MEGLDLLQDLAIIMLVAGLAGWGCQRIGLSSVVGFLFAGILIGPYTPPFALVSDEARIQTLSQLGLVFLMFSVGMGLSIRRLKRMGVGILIATAVTAIIVFFASRAVAIAIGWSASESLFLAAMLMVSSSAIISKVLHEIGATHEAPSRKAMAITVLEDVVAVVMLTILTSLAQVSSAGAGSPPIAQTLGLIVVFVTLLVIAGLLFVPRVLSSVTKSAEVDLQTIIIVGMVLIAAIMAVRAGYSLALGAFLLGAIVAETAQRAQVERYLQGLRDVFTAVFFVSIGMMMDVRAVMNGWHLIVLFSVFTLVVRPFAASIGLMLIGTPTRDSVRSGLMVTPIGEFSFIIAQLGVATKGAPEVIYPLAVGLALVTSVTAPFFIKHSATLSRGIERFEPEFLKNLIRIYQEALARIESRQQGSVLWQLSRRRVIQIGVGVLFVTGLLAFSEKIASAVFTRFDGQSAVWGIAFWTILVIVALVPLIAIWRNVAALSSIVAEAVTNDPHGGRLRGAIETALMSISAAAIGIWLWILLPIETTAGWTIAVVVLIVTFLTILLRNKFIRLHHRVETHLEGMLAEEEEEPKRNSEALLQPHREWNLHVHEIVLGDDTKHAGKSLAELHLRQQFGCSIAGVERHGYPIPNPGPDLVLYPGDKLLVLATPEAMNKLRSFLNQPRPGDEKTDLLSEIEMEGVSVPEGSPAADKLLVELELPAATGVQLVGIERGGNRLLNPGPFQGVEVGDRLLALGTPEQIKQFEKWLKGNV